MATKRPTVRPSPLAGRSPVHPQGEPETAAVVPEATDTHSEPVKPVAAPAKPAAEVKDVDKPKKDGFYIKPSDKERAERARTTTSIHTGLRSWTAYVNEAIMVYTKQLEQQHNDSKPF